MKLMVVGGGAREHALAARLALDPGVGEILCVPGNPGIAAIARTVPADLESPDQLLALAVRERVDLTVVGPEVPLSKGLADRFAAASRPLLGPSATAARLETSKAFAKSFMARHAIPTARFRTCETASDAHRCIASGEFGLPVVLKADGLAAGKGVVVAFTRSEAEEAIEAAMSQRRFGEAGARLVLEECLTGPEVSFFVICDGGRAIPIGTAQDHKRIFDDDRGPNTGGMGAFAPSPLVDEALQAYVMSAIVKPVIHGMATEGSPFRGFLYVGLMLTAHGPKVIEFNVRLGDPEAQVILPLIDEPLVPLLADAASGALRRTTCRRSSDKLVGVVLASRGYPETSESGRVITGIDAAQAQTGVAVYHAGTAMLGGRLTTAGGRVLTVVGRGRTLADAVARAYVGVSHIAFDGMQFRRDIGRKALEATAEPPSRPSRTL